MMMDVDDDDDDEMTTMMIDTILYGCQVRVKCVCQRMCELCFRR